MEIPAEAMRDIIYTRTLIPHAWLLSAIRVVLKVFSSETGPSRIDKLAFKHYLARCVVFPAHSGLSAIPILALIHQIATRIIKGSLGPMSPPVHEFAFQTVSFAIQLTSLAMDEPVKKRSDVYETEFM